MMSLLKGVSPTQWIMLVAMLVITSLMVVASSAHAGYLRMPLHRPIAPKGQLISHCGWVEADNKIYTRSYRNTRIIQRKLTEMGYSLGRAGIDGKFGPKTRAAVAAFQNDYGLSADGMVGEHTATQLAYNTHPAANVRRCKRPYAG